MEPTRSSVFDDLLKENREFTAPPSFRDGAAVKDGGIYERAAKDPEAYWAEEAKRLTWFTPWDRTLDWKPPHARWFTGGKINVSYNCLDRHLEGPRRNKAALIWEGENGEVRTLTYLQLHREVCAFANCLKDLGVGKGDRVAISYTPDPALSEQLKQHVVKKIGALARPEDILFTRDLPKTRSGKIMRRLLRDIAEGRALGDVTTLADPAVVAALRDDYEEKYGA